MSFPIKTANLKELTDLTKKIDLNLNKEIGWYFNLGASSGGTGWRVTSDSTSYLGTVAFAAMLPSSDSACEPSGSNRIYAIDLGTGQSRLIGASGNTLAYSTKLSGVVTDLRFYSVNKSTTALGGGSESGTLALVGGGNDGSYGRIDVNVGAATGLRRLNWREVPLSD